MTVANVSRNRLRGLPKELQAAQESINLPEVQEMLQKLSQYNLGVYNAPHARRANWCIPAPPPRNHTGGRWSESDIPAGGRMRRPARPLLHAGGMVLAPRNSVSG